MFSYQTHTIIIGNAQKTNTKNKTFVTNMIKAQYALAKDSKNNKNVMGIEPDTCYQHRLYAFSYNLILRP